MIQSSSQVYLKAAGLVPTAADVVVEATHCVMCAAPLAAGEKANKVTKATFGDAFNNKLDLRAISGTHVCGACQALWSKDWLQKYSKSYACAEGVFKLASNEDQAAFLLNPPPPPFVAILSTRQQQHMIWRTPVSLSQELFFVRMDGDVVTIRRRVLMEALDAYKHIVEVMASTLPEGRKRPLKGPPAWIDRQLESSKTGMLRTDVEALLHQVGDDWAVERLHGLTMGEWWALNIINRFDPQSPPPRRNALVDADDTDAS